MEPRPWEKVQLVLVLFVGTFAGYYAVGLTASHDTAAGLPTPLDDAIPLVPGAMWLYAWVYTAMFYPAFVVRCPFLFRRAALAYAVVVAVSLVAWVAYPVTSLGLPGRPAMEAIEPASFPLWGLKVNYTLDPPFNCFPSLHMSIATVAALSAAHARRLWGLVAVPPVVGIAVAIVAVKQHWALDGVAGVLLGAFAYAVAVRPARVAGRSEDELAYGWRAPASYLAFHCGVYAVLFALYVAGWAPWER
ncbi:MAG: phosphatase PAP2 family protein [Planctomycetes bacterium]|nr:phosphatase PAP2 family protein [Planctomycetota bacterium]